MRTVIQILDASTLSLYDRLPRNQNSTEEYIHPSAHKETVQVAKAGKMSRACGILQRGSNLRSCQRQDPRQFPCAGKETYSAGKTWCEWDPGNEPRHYSSPVRAVFVVAIAAAWIIHGVDIVCLLVHDPIVG
jgi:hypothetical protein